MHCRHRFHELEHQYRHPRFLDVIMTTRNFAYSRVRTPHLEISISDWLACCGVDKVDVQVRDGSLFTGKQVLADEFTNDP